MKKLLSCQHGFSWHPEILEALQNLFSAKLRSFLAILGILVGTASVVAMVTAGELATNEALKQFKSLGTDLLSVTIVPEQDKETHKLAAGKAITLDDALSFKKIDKNITDLAPYTQFFGAMNFEGHKLDGAALGVTENFQHISHLKLLKGRFVSILDGYQLFCVIGNDLYQQIKATSFVDPIGQPLQIGNTIFIIVGVLAPWAENNFVYANVDDTVLVPILASMQIDPSIKINNLLIQLANNANSEKVIGTIETAFKNLNTGSQLYVRSAKELVKKMGKQSQILTLFLGLIGCISLIVGGIGVMNIMLVSVIERRREIGIRLAVGATSEKIRLLFLIEAMLLSFFGGVLGIVIGLTIAYCIAFFSHWDFMFYLLPILIGFCISVATGIFFGFYPAYKASKLDPIEVLRSEV